MRILNKTLLTLVLAMLFASNLHGQSMKKTHSNQIEAEEGQNYAMLIRNMNHLNAAIKTVQMLEEDEQKTIANFEVVICGKEVKNLQKHNDIINSAIDHNIRLSACGMSLKKFSVPESTLAEGIQVVTNGLIRIFDLQEKGYKTIAL